MGLTLKEIAQTLILNDKKIQLIYGFNGTGKTRLSKEFKNLVDEKYGENSIIYYNAFTEDLFYWDNDLENDIEFKIKIHPNKFTDWIFKEQGKEHTIIEYFQNYTNDKLTPKFNENFSEITFLFARGDDSYQDNVKISRGEESNLIWCVFYSLLEEIIEVLNVPEKEERETNNFDELKYVFIDDPVSSLDDNHLIEVAVNLAQLIKYSESDLKFVITTHNVLFYNILHNELKNANKFFFKKFEDGTYDLQKQNNDSPFSYHIFLKNELENAIQSGKIYKYHYNFLRNILEKTSTFLGYDKWGDLLSKIVEGDKESYIKRIINFSSHSSHSTEEIKELTEDDKRVIKYLYNMLDKLYKINY